MRKQVLIVIGVALTSFLMGTMFSTNYLAFGGKPNPVWEAIYDLQRRIQNIEHFTDETSRVEFLGMEIIDLEVRYYYYTYGVSGHWNISKIQTESFIDKVNSTLSGLTSINLGGFMSNPFEHQGYANGVSIGVTRELSEVETETLRVLIEGYLAKP